MCYDVTSATRTLIKYAKHRGDDPAYIAALERKLEELKKSLKSHFQISGFAHPKLLVFTQDLPDEPQAFYWGLIPSWIKDETSAKKIYNQTLNARGETIFEKPAFKSSAIKKRCLIYLDAFYEHHHLGKHTYPFHIQMKDGSPLAVAGLYDEWVNKETGEVISTSSIVTTRANGLMAKIHNNPKAEGPRMPVIIPKELQNDWLIACTNEKDKERLIALIKPFDENLLTFHTVRKIKGKDAVGDVEEAEKKFDYPELAFEFNL